MVDAVSRIDTRVFAIATCYVSPICDARPAGLPWQLVLDGLGLPRQTRKPPRLPGCDAGFRRVQHLLFALSLALFQLVQHLYALAEQALRVQTDFFKHL